MASEFLAVPCNGCKLCCQNDLILVHPEHDDVTQYQTVPVPGMPGQRILSRLSAARLIVALCICE